MSCRRVRMRVLTETVAHALQSNPFPTANGQTAKCQNGQRPTPNVPTQLVVGRRKLMGHSLLSGQRLRRLGNRPDDASKLTPLQELAPLAAPAGDLVLRGADCLLGSPT